MTIEIKHRYTGATLYSADVATLREALERAVKAGADLRGANLFGADLTRATLDGATLTDANLTGANLFGADLTGADLTRANLTRATLDGANLTDASLDGAQNVDPKIDYMKPVRDDFRNVLDAAPNEVERLLAKLWAGEVDGSVYEGECCCLVGTIAKLRGCKYDAIPGIVPDGGRPAERWFLRISKGSTPLTNPSAAYAAAVIAQWQHERAGKRTKKAKAKINGQENA
jgi:hypothetical protein